MYGTSTPSYSGIVFKDEDGTFILSITLQNIETLNSPNCKCKKNSFYVEVLMSIHNRIDFLIFLKEVLEKEEDQQGITFLEGIIEELEEDVKPDLEYSCEGNTEFDSEY